MSKKHNFNLHNQKRFATELYRSYYSSRLGGSIITRQKGGSCNEHRNVSRFTVAST